MACRCKASTACFVFASTQIDTIGHAKMEDNVDDASVSEREFEHRMKALEKKFKKTNKPKDVRKALYAFEHFVVDFFEEKMPEKRLRVIEDFFETKVENVIVANPTAHEYFLIWMTMMIYYQTSNRMEMAKKYRRNALKSQW